MLIIKDSFVIHYADGKDLYPRRLSTGDMIILAKIFKDAEWKAFRKALENVGQWIPVE